MALDLEPLRDFLSSFGIHSLEDFFDYPLVYYKQRYWLVPESLQIWKSLTREPYYLGAFLGEKKSGIFRPSLYLLSLMAGKTPFQTVVKEKTAWLFTCKRDIMESGILHMNVNARGYTLVVDEHGNALGLAKQSKNHSNKKTKNILLEHVIDIGDFLRRER